ncbi:hypothetical protein SAMN05216262_11051 [Colwellia chukchiensis]|uniref:Uncharacterized protein n=1 Tax=Colwellia chukchiensis TaxID=641665 RepID=A0A1H7PVV1_9GAMM|nr:hypothetical protein [Colwellia chukchiensis]SEL39598.1 hypothetical protein SAMN05216262_11051 [Colwellia chukchiensis]
MISKKVREFFVSLMEAGDNTAVCYDKETEQYSGFFNNTVVDKYIELGAIELVEADTGATVILLNNRDDFLSSFAAGVREAKNGSDQSYADYNANPFAFSVGFEHFHQLAKKKRQLIGYICHGFENDATGLIHQQ